MLARRHLGPLALTAASDMHSAPHRNNSDFQLRHFIAGSCHTADAAWNVLYEQRIDIQTKLVATKARLLQREAKRLDLEEMKSGISSRQDALRYEAARLEFDVGEGLLELAISGAERELATIDGLMAELEPQRRYGHLPLLEATEAAQQDEWREEFKHRIENYLASQGFVPHDQLEAMRKHPDWSGAILPHLKKNLALLESAESRSQATALLASRHSLAAPTTKEDHGTDH